MTKRKSILTLPSNQKRYTSPLGVGFRCLDESYDEGPSSKCETAYESHKKPSEFNSSNISFRKKPDVNTTSSIKPSTARPQVNLGILGLSSLPQSEWINSRKRTNLPMCPLVQEEPTPDVSAHLKKPPVNPHKKSILPLPVGAALTKNNKKEKDETVTDPDCTMTQPSKRTKKAYVSTLPRNYRRRPLSLHSSAKSKENSKKNASKIGTAEHPVCLDTDDCIIEDVQQASNPSQPSPSQPSPSQPSLPSSAICTQSKVFALSNPTEWDNIDLLRYISQIYFSHLDLTPLNVEYIICAFGTDESVLIREITSSELTISVEHKDDNATLTIRYNELDCIEMNLTGRQPHLMILNMRTDHFNKHRKLLMSKLKLHNFWYTTDNYVVLVFDNKLDVITIQHIEEKFPTHIRVLKLELHQVDEFLQNRKTKSKNEDILKYLERKIERLERDLTISGMDKQLHEMEAIYEQQIEGLKQQIVAAEAKTKQTETKPRSNKEEDDSDSIRIENNKLKEQISQLKLEVSHQKLQLEGMAAENEGEKRKLHEKYEDKIKRLGKKHAEKMDSLVVNLIQEHSESDIARLKTRLTAYETRIKQLEEELEIARVDSGKEQTN